MKKILFLVAMALMLSLGISVSAAGIVDSGVYAGDFKYVLDSDGHLVVSGTGNMSDYYIDDRPPWHIYKSQIKRVTVSNGIKNVANSAFSDCEMLELILIPASVETIGGGAFSRCSSLVEIRVNSNNDNYYSVDGVLFEKGTNTLVKYPSSKVGIEYEIPNGITAIGDNAFWMCRKLSTIKIPDGVTNIGNGAFWLCSALRNVEIPDSVVSIGDAAFSGCSWMSTLNIPTGVTSIGNKAFANCTSMTEMVIPDNVTTLGNGLFFNCSKLEKVTLPGNITRIGDNQFLNCKKLSNVNIPYGVTAIGDSAFYGCSALWNLSIPNSVTAIDDNAFYDCTSLTAINYGGSEAEWRKVNDKSNLKKLASVVIRYNNESISVKYNGKKIEFDQPPIIENGRTLVPLRAICEVMGADVEWDNDKQTITATLDEITLQFTIGKSVVTVQGREKKIDQAPIIRNGRTLLPARAFAEEFGANVVWDDKTKTVSIEK